MTREELEKLAIDDYKQVLGRPIFVLELHGYRDGCSLDIGLDTPAKVKVVKTDEQSILHWNGDWLDPYWELELLKPHPTLAGIRSLYMFGDSYSLDGKMQPASYEPRIGPREWSPRGEGYKLRRRSKR